jgi:tetratricopeptide (TPR) repeat protein
MYDRLGLVRLDEGDFVDSLTSMGRAREMFASLGKRAQEARVLAHMATARCWMGALEEAEENAQEAMELAQRAGSRRAQSSVEVTLGMIEAAIGREGAAERLRNAATLGREIGNRSIQARAWLTLSDLEEDPADAEAHIRRVLKLCQGSGLVHLQVLALTRLAENALLSGRVDEAESASAEAVEKLRLHGNVQGPEERVLMARADVLAALGRDTESTSLIEEAAQVVRAKAERIPHEGDRRRFLELPPNHRILEAAPDAGSESVP